MMAASTSEASDAILAAEGNDHYDHKMTMHENGRPKHVESGQVQEDGALKSDFKAVQRSFGFWAIIVGLGIMLLLSALEK
jgi:hypothetical protein